MLKRFKSVSLMMLLMGLPTGVAMAETAPVDTYAVVQQSGPATGTVFDEAGEPLTGASVIVKGTTNGAMVDNDGRFTLTGVKPGQTLRITFIGYDAQEVVWKGEPLDIVLNEMANNLGEAVVIGYGVAKKNDLTGSVVAIKPDEKNHGLITNAQDMMQGKIAGVNVVSGSGAPGEGATIRVRGGSSLNASNDPLIVIDGLAMDNSARKGSSNILSSINPADIESFTVLKDASATAIYGSRGSNGVIIITTKKGRTDQKAKVSYSGTWGMSKNLQMLDVMDADEYRSFIANYYGTDSEAYSKLGNAKTDWQKEIYQTAMTHEHDLTVTGGTKHMPYRVSLGYMNQEGIVKTSEYERYTGSFNLNPNFLDDHLKVTINGKYMLGNTRHAAGVIGLARRFDPTQSPYSDAEQHKNFGGYFQWEKDGKDLNDPGYLWTKNTNATSNPVAALNLTDNHNHNNALIGNLEGDYQIHGFEDLRIHMNVAGEYDWGRENSYGSPMGYDNFYYGWDGWNKETRYNLTYTAYGQYYKDFNDAHHFDIMAGYEWSHKYYEGSQDGWGYYGVNNTGTDNDGNPLAGQKYNPFATSWKGESFLVSFLGRANYILLDRYLFTATVRYDGSSRFEQHWSLFPSFAFGWRIKDEAFLKDVDWVSELKLRLGYGMTGQQDGIGNYNYFAAYNVSKTTIDGALYPITGLEGGGVMYRPDAYNKKLKWETTTTYNAGLDFGIVYGKLFGSIDYYYRNTTDLLNTVYVAAGSNFRNQVMGNVGSLTNQGVELALTYRPIQKNNWFWEITANATYNINEITETAGGQIIHTGGVSAGTGTMVQAHAEGHPASSFLVYQQVYNKDGMPLEGIYVDRNGDGQINESDKYFYKSPAAPWVLGLSTRLQYKNWDLGFGLRASIGNYVYNDTEAGYVNVDKTYDSSFGYTHNILRSSAKMGWTTYDNVLSDYFVQNGSFLKCDNITLGYSFDHLFKSANYEGLNGRIYAAASNVFTITKYKGLDPEVSGGIDNNLYPRPFTFQLGVNFNF